MLSFHRVNRLPFEKLEPMGKSVGTSGLQPRFWILLGWSCFLFAQFPQPAEAFATPRRAPLPEIDLRIVPPAPPISQSQKAAAEHLRTRLPQFRVDFHPLLGSPALIFVRESFLASRDG